MVVVEEKQVYRTYLILLSNCFATLSLYIDRQTNFMHQFSSVMLLSGRIRGIMKLGFSKLTLASRSFIFQSKKRLLQTGHESGGKR